MRKKRLLAGILTGLALICSLLYNNMTYAEEVSTYLTLSPPNQKIILKPGETFHGSIDITNSVKATQNLNYLVSVGSFSQVRTEESKDDYGDVDIISESSYNQMMDWISIDNPTGSVPPNETVTVGYKIKVPDNAPAGGQYATILVSENPQVDSEQGGNSASVGSVLQLASVIYAEVAGTTSAKGEIVENNIPSFLTSGPLEATSTVKNEGNVHTDAKFIFQVWPLFSDEEICTNEENVSESLILPETERYHVESCDLPMVGIFKAKQIVRIFGEESIVEKTVVICPIWLMLVVAFGIVLVIVWLFIRIKNRDKQSRRSAATE